MSDMCNACFLTSETRTVLVRHNREDGWVESTVQECANEACRSIRGGSINDRVTHIRNVYDYKYFGDYELSVEQAAAVWDAYSLAHLAPDLLEALTDCLDRFVEAFPAAAEYGPIKRGYAAIAKAEGR